ncbi:fimbrial protein [Siccibacter colletis]|uniref:fimbrial protein n=1 Tax=Siccibacter colletis TaxID=1505757 RepID=UPI0005691863|nr:fimbrial protein [Siccibacter colletis]
MELNKIILSLMSSCLFYSSISNAVDSTMTFTASVVASPCTVSSESITKTIALDDGNGLQTKDLQSAGATSKWVDFNISLTDCPAGTSRVTATFNGTEDSDDPAYYKNSGTAKNIAVQLDSKGGALILSNGKSYIVDITTGATEIPLSARTITTNGGVTPGTVQTVVTANLTYQ